MLTVAIQYPSFGPQHPPRLTAIAHAAPRNDVRLVAMEMFAKDSDYEWQPVSCSTPLFERYTVVQDASATARRSPLSLRRHVRKALQDISPGVLVVNGWGHIESRVSLGWARQSGCPLVLLGDSPRDNMRRVWWKEAIKRYVIRGCRSAFVAGTPQARYVERLGIPKSQIFHPGSCVVDNEYWRRESDRCRNDAASLRRQYDLPEEYFLCVARFIDCKNLPVLIRAYARYRQSAPPPHLGLLLCGSGPEEARLRAIVREGNVRDVYYPGFRQVDELPVYYALASCFVLPSLHTECWGLVVNEAMACGLPVLVSKMCGCAEDLVQEGKNGYSFDPANEEELGAIMAKIADSRDRLSSLGAESRAIIEGHSCEVGAQNLWKAVTAALR